MCVDIPDGGSRFLVCFGCCPKGLGLEGSWVDPPKALGSPVPLNSPCLSGCVTRFLVPDGKIMENEGFLLQQKKGKLKERCQILPSASPWEWHNPGKGIWEIPGIHSQTFLMLPYKTADKQTALKMGSSFVGKWCHFPLELLVQGREILNNHRTRESLERLEKPSGISH